MPDSDLGRSSEFIDRLRFPERPGSAMHDPEIDTQIAAVKAEAVRVGDELEAADAWRAETILEVQRGFVSMFELLKSGKYYPAWCQLERCEIQLASLLRHFAPGEEDEHRLLLIGNMIERWQELFPYRVFFSPEFVKTRVVCSICGGRVTPRSDCGHTKHQLYRGQLCYHIVKDVQIISISMVEHPVQRYSVAFLSGPDGEVDHYDYGNLKFVVDRVESVFHEWWSERTTRKIPATAVSHLVALDPCPCLSGKTFGSCCSGSEFITVPHLQITLAVPPADKNLPSNELLF